MKAGLVSIVLPVYNGEKYLNEAIGSILNQTYTNWELIIVDDCSIDKSYDIALTYSAKYSNIYVIRNTENSKLPKSLNAGFSLAKGEYLCWTSDDNRYKPTALEKMVSVLTNRRDVDFIYADMDIIDQDGAFQRHSVQDEANYLVIRNVVGACFLYRAKLAKRVGEFNENMFLIEDYDYWIRCFLSGKFFHLKEFLYEYRLHGGSLTTTRIREIHALQEKVFNTYYDNYKQLQLDNDVKYRLYDKAYSIGREKHLYNFILNNPRFIVFILKKRIDIYKIKLINILRHSKK